VSSTKLADDNTMISRLLIVEDEIDLRQSMVDFLANDKLEIVQASNGLEGLERATQEQFHAIVCDINMPKKTGLEFLAELRAKGDPTPFVIVSAHSDRKSTLEALRLGAFDFIDKPFDVQQLIRVVGQALEVGAQIQFWKTEPEAIKNLESLKTENAQAAMRSLEKALKLIRPKSGE
jgi:DNA-binding NtrC family response regulator